MNQEIGPNNFQLPIASFQALNGLIVTVAIPVYDRVFILIARRFTWHLSDMALLQRIGIGLFLSSLNMAVLVVVEEKRVSVAKEYNILDSPKATVPMLLLVWLMFSRLLGSNNYSTIKYQSRWEAWEPHHTLALEALEALLVAMLYLLCIIAHTLITSIRCWPGWVLWICVFT